MKPNNYDKFLSPYYLGERGFSIPINEKFMTIHKLVSTSGKIPAKIPEEIKEKHALFIKSGGVLNEVSGFNSLEIDIFVKQQIQKYLLELSQVIAENHVTKETFSALSKVREILHTNFQIPFAMEINPLSENSKDYSNRQKRVLLDPKQEVSRDFNEIINKCSELESLFSSEEIITQIQEILGEYLNKTGAVITGIVFDDGNSLNVAKKEIPRLLKIYEKRMKQNKNRKHMPYSNLDSFSLFSGPEINKLSMAHNKVGETGIHSFIRSSFQGKNKELFQQSGLRIAYGETVEITNQDVQFHALLAKKIASILETKSAEIIQSISNNTNSILI